MRPPGPLTLNNGYVAASVYWALVEDGPTGDMTTDACVDWTARVDAKIIAKAPGVIAGTEFAREAFHQCGAHCELKVGDGDRVVPGQIILVLEQQPARSVLKAERVALNFLGHLSGIATTTAEFVKACEGTGAEILDTRKTTPGLRVAEKAAVKAGGGQNHRQGLSDGILIKENHIRAAGAISRAVSLALQAAPDDQFVEVEVTNLDEMREAMDNGAKIVLLDNMSEEMMREAAAKAKERGVRTEASGNVNLENVRRIAQTGVDYISIGWLTHSARALDLSLLVEYEPLPDVVVDV
ncbi:MAG: carboxylating nicotinate-nucleotide diphosphorylase [Armatimonadetes bacterium]|nr:carboxylating nicotinate-nucleotide diphosphorylase [Armatimonadota bacterium]